MSGIFDSRQVRRAFARAAGTYEANAVLQDEVGVRLRDHLQGWDSVPRTVLDLGSGTGKGSAALRKLYPQAQVIALDVALPMLQAAKRHGSWLRPLTRVCGDAEALPLAAASVDLIHSNLCLQWCGDLNTVFSEFRRVLRPGGRVLFSTFGPDTLHELREAFAEVDGSSRVSGFVDMHQIGDALLVGGFRDPVMERDDFTLTYADAMSLLRDLRAIGATHAGTARARSLTGKSRFAAAIRAYEAFRRDGVLPATYEVIYADARAPDIGQPQRDGGVEIASFSLDQLRGSRRRQR